MAVSVPQEYPEFRRPRAARPSHSPRPNHRLGAAPEAAPARVRRARASKGSLAARALRSRLLDDACAMMVWGIGIVFVLQFARMLLTK